MDALDLNWCLACGCRIELVRLSTPSRTPSSNPPPQDVCTPYCSQNCLNSDQPSTSALPSYPTYSSFPHPDSILDEEDSYHYDDAPQDMLLASSARNAWIGRGEAGIRAWAQSIPSGMPYDTEDTHFGTLKPKLLQSPQRVKPSLCMSRAQPAPPEPSRPILTPQQSLPSLSRDSTSIPSTSMVSLTTGSSSYSVVTPATGSEVGSLRDSHVPNSNTNFLGGLKAQLRAWATSSTPQKDAPRSTTLTRKDTVRIVDHDADSVPGLNVRRAPSPAAFFMMPEQYSTIQHKETRSRAGTKENIHPAACRRPAVEDHPAYRTRGRKASRIAS